jgi:ribose 5-phosphate isomerase RpiB
LTLGSGQNSIEEMKGIIDAFLTAELSEDRHKRRVGKIDNIDRQYRR